MTDDAVALARRHLDYQPDDMDSKTVLCRELLSLAAERDRLAATIAAAESVQHPLYALAPVVDKQAAMIDRLREALAEALRMLHTAHGGDIEWARIEELRKLVGG